MSFSRKSFAPNEPVPIHLGPRQCVRCGDYRVGNQLKFPICGPCYAKVWAKDKKHCTVCKKPIVGKFTLCEICMKQWTDFEKQYSEQPAADSSMTMTKSEAVGLPELKPVVLPPCPLEKEGNPCHLVDEEHLSCYSHSDITPPREICPRYPNCFSTDEKHLRQFAHPLTSLPCVRCQNINTHDPGEPENFSEDQYSLWQIDFMANEEKQHKRLVTYMEKNGFNDAGRGNLRAIADWFRKARPVHMCSGSVLLSMIKMDSLNSIRGLQSLWIHPVEMADAVLARSDLQDILQLIPDLVYFKEQFVIPLIQELQGNWDFSDYTPIIDKNTKKPVGLPLYEIHKQYVTPVPDYIKNNTRVVRCKMFGLIGKRRLDLIEEAINDVLRHVYTTLSGPLGIAWPGDINVRSDFSVFTIVGPHMGNYGNGEAVLILKPEIMYHPDFNMTLYAASGYCAVSDNWYHGGFGDDRTAWMGKTSQDRRESMRAFSQEKFHPSAEMWPEDAAREWMCRVYTHSRYGKTSIFAKNKKKPLQMNEITLDHVKELISNFTDRGSHTEIEGHVPDSVSLKYVERVILTESTHALLERNSLGRDFLRRFEKMGPGYLTVVKNKIDFVREAIWKELDEPLGANVPSGFTFSVSEKQLCSTFIPLSLPSVCMVTFACIGGSFSLFFTNFPDTVRVNPNGSYASRRRLQFSFDAEKKEMRVVPSENRYSSSYGPRTTTHATQILSFNHPDAPHIDPNEAVYWAFFISSENHFARVALAGPSRKYYQWDCPVKHFPDSFEFLNYIAFEPVGRPYTIWNLKYSKERDLTLFH